MATDGESTIAFEEGKEKPSKKHTWEAFRSHIAPGTLLAHVGENSHTILVERLHLTDEVHTTKEKKG